MNGEVCILQEGPWGPVRGGAPSQLSPPAAGFLSEELSLPQQPLCLRSQRVLGLRGDGVSLRDRVGTRTFLGVAGARPQGTGWVTAQFIPGAPGKAPH